MTSCHEPLIYHITEEISSHLLLYRHQRTSQGIMRSWISPSTMYEQIIMKLRELSMVINIVHANTEDVDIENE